MERNSRDFRPRVARINRNTELICDFLNGYKVGGGRAFSGSNDEDAKEGGEKERKIEAVVKSVYYPKYITTENYVARRRHLSSSSRMDQTDHDQEQQQESGYGGLFSITFNTLASSRAFFDALSCCKGPSLGTNFTLACPYTVLAHYLELEWAAEWEVEEGLVRVSVGLEEEKTLLEWFGSALKAAERAGWEESQSKSQS